MIEALKQQGSVNVCSGNFTLFQLGPWSFSLLGKFESVLSSVRSAWVPLVLDSVCMPFSDHVGGLFSGLYQFRSGSLGTGLYWFNSGFGLQVNAH